MSKIHFESNSQPIRPRVYQYVYWKRYVKDTFWKQFTTRKVVRISSSQLKTICQRYILKAIHNAYRCVGYSWFIENDMSKIHFESNSQRGYQIVNSPFHWKRYVKDTFWKQFTTSINAKKSNNHWKRYVKDTFWKQFTTWRATALIW